MVGLTYGQQYAYERRWDKKALILYTYHQLQLMKCQGDWNLADTARVFSISMGKVSEDLNLAENLEIVSDCTSRNAALKRLKDVRENQNG